MTTLNITPDGLELASTEEVEQAIKELQLPLTVELRLSPSQKTRLSRLCADTNKEINEYIQALVELDLGQRIGRPTITNPTKLGNQPISAPGTVRGITGSVRRG